MNNADISNFDNLPSSALLPIATVAALLSCSAATVRRHVKAGKIPAPVALSARTLRWRAGDVRAVISGGNPE